MKFSVGPTHGSARRLGWARLFRAFFISPDDVAKMPNVGDGDKLKAENKHIKLYRLLQGGNMQDNL